MLGKKLFDCLCFADWGTLYIRDSRQDDRIAFGGDGSFLR
jgi:hypothetical protein